MRRSDRQVKDFGAILDILGSCDVCRLAFNDVDAPYIVPLNFGISVDGERVVLYFHGATEGRKLDLIRSRGVAAFEADCGHRLVSDSRRGYCTMEYASVMGVGEVEIVDDEAERERGLELLAAKYHPDGFEFDRAAMPRTAVFKLVVKEMTAKARKVNK